MLRLIFSLYQCPSLGLFSVCSTDIAELVHGECCWPVMKQPQDQLCFSHLTQQSASLSVCVCVGYTTLSDNVLLIQILVLVNVQNQLSSRDGAVS